MRPHLGCGRFHCRRVRRNRLSPMRGPTLGSRTVTDVVATPEQTPPPPVEPPRPHPVRLVDHDDLRRSRLTVFARWVLVFPHLIWLSLYSLMAIVVAIANWIVTLIRGR